MQIPIILQNVEFEELDQIIDEFMYENNGDHEDPPRREECKSLAEALSYIEDLEFMLSSMVDGYQALESNYTVLAKMTGHPYRESTWDTYLYNVMADEGDI